jgi:hypothetical protein
VTNDQKTACCRAMPIPALAGSRAPGAPARGRACVGAETGRSGRVAYGAQPVRLRSLPRLAYGSVSRPRLALHSSGSYGYDFIAPRARLCQARSAGERSTGPFAFLAAPSAASGHTSPAPASGIPVRNPGYWVLVLSVFFRGFRGHKLVKNTGTQLNVSASVIITLKESWPVLTRFPCPQTGRCTRHAAG